MNFENLGFIKVGSAVPTLSIANPEENVSKIKDIIINANNLGIKILSFPELCITGYTCNDLFNQSILINEAKKQLLQLVEDTSDIDMLISVGVPLRIQNQLFNCAVVFKRGEILGVIPKMFIPNYNEFYEKRWFTPANLALVDKIILNDKEVPFGTNILFKEDDSDICIGVEICEDLWIPNPPSINHTLHGANIILNLSASNELIGKYQYRRNLVSQQSAKCICSYIYCSAGQDESTTDIIFSGHSIISENGSILAEDRFNENDSLIYSEIDIERLMNDRQKFNSYTNNVPKEKYNIVNFSFDDYRYELNNLSRKFDIHPFVPRELTERNERCEEILKMQSIGLSQRLKKTKINKVVLGISGGLDSTLALLVAVKSMKNLQLPMKNIIGITMPGFGTTSRTYNNAIKLMRELDITIKEISIKDACIQHFKDIGQDINTLDITYENSQARERTQILMDVANKESALVIGTGDLSELALGWCTFNGDHMSMYGVNASIPKTLVKHLVKWYAEDLKTNKVEDFVALANGSGSLKTEKDYAISKLLFDILETPVSPELLPADDNGEIQQKTEDKVGPYELHDFFLYYMIRFGYSPRKIFSLACISFNNYTEKEILKWLKEFIKRFFTSQFKRDAIPAGIKVGSISLSPRGDWRMPSDASYNLWMNELLNIEKYI